MKEAKYMGKRKGRQRRGVRVEEKEEAAEEERGGRG